jgi:two-component system phosphate regulon sensor histidine kinase PhoR
VGEVQLREVEVARLLLEAARYLGETLEPRRVYERFREILGEAIPHDGVVVSSFDPRERLIRCDYAWVDGELLDVAIFPPLHLSAKGGMQSEVIRTGRPLLTNDVAARVQDSGTYYDVDASGTMRKVPDEGPPKPQAAMMLPVKHEGRVVGVVQLMSEHVAYRQDQLELAEGIVAQLGAAVRNARLHEERLQLEASAAAARATALERERAAQVLEAVGDGIFFVDEAGTIRFWNRAAESITQLRRDSVQDRAVTELGPDWAALATTVPAAEGDERPRPVALPVEADCRELWLSFVAVQTHDGIVYAFRDVTVERQLEESRHEIIATVSHELRTPLTAVLGAASTLLRSDIDLASDDRQQLLEMIATQATRLSQVTESILLAGRIDRDEVSIETTRIHVDTIVRETVGALEANLPSSVRVEEQLEAPGFALGDANRLQQVLINLLDNAVKYSPGGERILVRTSQAADQVRIEVVDEGTGIAQTDHERVFEKFYRGDSSRRLAPSGTGLGLYICRGLLERMGGRISVSSRPGAGSTFIVEMPAAP